MDKLKVRVFALTILSLLAAVTITSTDSDASSNSSGSIINDDVSVTYIGYTDNGYGLLGIIFNGHQNSDSYTISIDDGKISAPIKVDNKYSIKCEELLSEGDHTIHIVCGSKSWNLTLEVSVPTESVTLDKDSVTLLKGQSIKLSADVMPLDATYRTVFWKSSDSSVVKVSQDGTVVAVSNGIAIISAQAGGQTANCRIAVITYVDSVSLNYQRLSLVVGESAQLSATVFPADASDKSVYWRSSDETIATVNQYGTVTTIAPGTVTITAEAGSQQASCVITVSNPSEHEHSWGTGQITKAPTCTETGVRTYTCSCGEVMEEIIPATGHTWDSGSVTFEPTCTEPGIITYICTECGETRTESIPALGHSWSEWKVEKEATYQKDGYQIHTCSKCGTTEAQIIPRLTHDVHIWGDGVIITEPTCTESGVRTYTCVCGETKTETIPATGHDWIDTSSEGYTERTCSICGTTERTHDNDDGSKTTTTTDPDGLVTKVTEGGEDGSKTVETIKTESDNSGNSVAKTETIRTESDGSETSTKTTTVAKPDGTVISSDTEIIAKDETTGTTTVVISKTDSSGKVSCESTTTVIAESSGDGTASETRVSDESIDAAMKQMTSMSDSIKSPEKTIHIETGSEGTVTSDVVILSKASMDSILTLDNVKISISASTAKLVFDSDVVSNLKDKGELSVSVKTDVKDALTDRQKEKVGDDIVVDLSMKAGGTNVHGLGGKATISIPFDATGYNTDNLSVWYIDGDNLVWVSNVTYSDGRAIFEVEHFSMYVIKENVSPPDIDNSDDGNNLLLYSGIVLLIIIVVSCVVVLKRRT